MAKFAENLIYRDTETYDFVVSHFNKISEIEKNKKFEWEYEELPEEEFNIGKDFQKWLQIINDNYQYLLEQDEKEPLVFPVRLEFSKELFELVKNYFDGFVYDGSTGIYNKQPFMTKTKKAKTKEELVELCKDLRKNSKAIFLHRIHEDVYKTLISLGSNKSEDVYGEEKQLYVVRYVNF